MNTLKFGNGEWYGKKDTILAYNDENSNFKPLPFNFERASSATVVNKEGLIETVGAGMPRIDYKDDSEGALLLEPTRKNDFTNSEDFSTNWSASNVLANVNQIISPDGTLNADLVYENTGTQPHFAFQTVGTTTTNDYTVSVFAKYSGRFLQVFAGGGDVSGNPYANFDLENGVLNNNGCNDAFIEDYGNGWFRCGVVVTSAVTSGFNPIFGLVKTLNSSRASSYTGNGTSGVYLWGAQLEQGSYATSYIPTSGSSVTRFSELNPFERTDLVSKNLVGDTEMTWFLDAYIFNRNSTTVSPKIENNSNGNIFIGLNVTNDTSLNIRHKDGTTASNTSSISFTNGQRTKVAIRIIGTSATAFINGVKVGDFTSSSIDSFDVFSSANGNPYNINDLRFYNTALTDQELKSLTQ